MHYLKLIVNILLVALSLQLFANEQYIEPLTSTDPSPSILGDVTFPPFSGLLFAGTSGNSANPDDTQNGIVLFDIDTQTVVFSRLEIQVWGATADPTNRRIFFSVASNGIGSLGGDELFSLSYDGGTAESLGVILNPLGEPLRMDGLAIINDQLFAALDGAAGGGDPDGLYLVDLATNTSTLVTSFTGIGGIEASPNSGRLFGTNDDTGMLVEIDINNDTVTDLAAYPEDFTDIDALASDNDLLYLITDEEQAIQVFDINTNTFVDTLPALFLIADTFAGAALAIEPETIATFIPPAVPTLRSNMLLLFALLIGLTTVWFMQKNQSINTNTN